MILYEQAWNRGLGGWRDLILPTAMQGNLLLWAELFAQYVYATVGNDRFRQPLRPPFFRLARKAVCSTMATSNVCHFIILSISVQTKKGMSEDSTHRKPLLCLVTSFIRAAGDRWMLVTRGTTRSESVFSMGSCPAQPIFNLNRVHKLTKLIR